MFLHSAIGSLALFFSSTAVAFPVSKRATGRTSTPSGCLTVRGSDAASGEYSTIAAALDALESSTDAACIFIYSGTYEEQFRIDYAGNLTLYGYTEDVSSYKDNTVTITHSETSTAAGSLDESSTANIVSDDFAAYNIDFVNSYGSGSQAVAVTANGDRQGFYGCGFYGYQDTLYAKAGYQYYSNCYIEGAVDFIFGAASAWFGECTIAASGAGYITANSRSSTSDTSWYVIDHSTITAAASVASAVTGKVYLGRPWRVDARVIYQDSVLTDVVAPAGWAPMADGATPTFEEWANTGAGADTSAREYETTATAAVSKKELWPSGYAWLDGSY